MNSIVNFDLVGRQSKSNIQRADGGSPVWIIIYLTWRPCAHLVNTRKLSRHDARVLQHQLRKDYRRYLRQVGSCAGIFQNNPISRLIASHNYVKRWNIQVCKHCATPQSLYSLCLSRQISSPFPLVSAELITNHRKNMQLTHVCLFTQDVNRRFALCGSAARWMCHTAQYAAGDIVVQLLSISANYGTAFFISHTCFRPTTINIWSYVHLSTIYALSTI